MARCLLGNLLYKMGKGYKIKRIPDLLIRYLKKYPQPATIQQMIKGIK